MRGFYNSAAVDRLSAAPRSPTNASPRRPTIRSTTALPQPQGDRAARARIVSAVRPAPMRWWMTYPMTVVDTVFKALAPAIPDRVIAGHHADLVTPSFHGINPKTREFFIGGLRPARRRLGREEDRGRRVGDGVPERRRHAQLSERAGRGEISRSWSSAAALIADSGGAGRHRGGLGIESVIRGALAISPSTRQTDRAALPALGARRRARCHRQPSSLPLRRPVEDRSAQRQDADHPPQAR